MPLTKSKKRRNKKAKKKKNLPIIDKEFIKNNQCWIPTNIKDKYTHKTDSWFDITSSHKNKPETKRKKRIAETSELRSIHIEIYPNTDQKIKLLKWMETCRKVYNLTITNRHKLMNDKGYMLSYTKMRTLIQTEYLPKEISLSKDIYKVFPLKSTGQQKYNLPSHCAWQAINDVNKAFVSAKSNKDAGNIKSFRLRHKKPSNPKRTLVLEQNMFSVKQNAFNITLLGEMKSSKPFGLVTHDCRLSYSYSTDKFILWKPVDKITSVECFRSSVIALDPGMRTFQNGYSPDGICFKFGTDKTNIKIKNFLKKIDSVVKDGRNYKKYKKRIRKKVTDMVADLHWKTANFLCKNFNTILVGNLSTTGIIKKNGSVLSPFNKRYVLALSHYAFREKLLSKAAEYDVVCLIVDESYTTKTCGLCGEQNQNVKASKMFKCPQETCAFKLDRDYNAGRNIYLKSLSNKLV